MRNPTIAQYIESISDSHGLFRTLEGISVVRDNYDYPIFRSGNYSVMFKTLFKGRMYGLKCYTRQVDYADEIYRYLESVESEYLNSVQLLVDELYVYDEFNRGRSYSVLLVEWIDGETLGLHVRRLCRENNTEALAELAVKFDSMAIWLLKQDFAHGDLKHDNILVTSKGELRLIDFDGLYIPSFAGRPCSLIGSPVYQHPKRDSNFFNPSVDDYPIGIISLSLHALSEDPSLYDNYNDHDSLIFNAAEVCEGESILLNNLMRKWSMEGNLSVLALARMLNSTVPGLAGISERLSRLSNLGEMNSLEGYEIIDASDTSCAVISRYGLLGFADTLRKEIILEPAYDTAQPFSCGLSLVRSGEDRLFINTKGERVIDCNFYQSVAAFRNSLSLVCSNGLFGFMDCTGKLVISLQYPFATSFRGGLAIFRSADNYGCIDTEGNIVIAAEHTLERCRELHFTNKK